MCRSWERGTVLALIEIGQDPGIPQRIFPYADGAKVIISSGRPKNLDGLSKRYKYLLGRRGAFVAAVAHGPRSTRELSRSGPTHKRLVRECIMPAHHLPVRCGDTPITHILEGAMAQPIPIIKWFFGLFLRFY